MVKNVFENQGLITEYLIALCRKSSEWVLKGWCYLFLRFLFVTAHFYHIPDTYLICLAFINKCKKNCLVWPQAPHLKERIIMLVKHPTSCEMALEYIIIQIIFFVMKETGWKVKNMVSSLRNCYFYCEFQTVSPLHKQHNEFKYTWQQHTDSWKNTNIDKWQLNIHFMTLILLLWWIANIDMWH